MSHTDILPAMRSCIDECNSCRDICTESMAHCLSLGGKHASADHIRTLVDWAELCATSSAFMLRSSDFQRDVCRVCPDACEGCAASCTTLGDDDVIGRCAEACRRCAESCHRMAGMTSIA